MAAVNHHEVPNTGARVVLLVEDGKCVHATHLRAVDKQHLEKPEQNSNMFTIITRKYINANQQKHMCHIVPQYVPCVCAYRRLNQPQM